MEIIKCGKTESEKMVHLQDFSYNSETGRIHLLQNMEFCLSVDKTGKSHGFSFTSKNRDRMSVDYCDFGFSKAIQFGRKSNGKSNKYLSKTLFGVTLQLNFMRPRVQFLIDVWSIYQLGKNH